MANSVFIGPFGFASSGSSFIWPAGTALVEDAVNVLGQHNGTAAQTLNIYNTFTSLAAYERMTLQWTGNVFLIRPEAAGGGTVRSTFLAGADLNFQTGTPATNTRWTINSTGHFITGVDNTFDIGAVGATRPRTVYAATSVISPLYVVGATNGVNFGPSALASITIVGGIVTAAS